MARHKATISYDDVAEWWENSSWNMSTYPPSAWHKYAEREGLTLEDVIEDAVTIEAGVAEMVADDEENEND
jgi:hypothetical protein